MKFNHLSIISITTIFVYMTLLMITLCEYSSINHGMDQFQLSSSHLKAIDLLQTRFNVMGSITIAVIAAIWVAYLKHKYSAIWLFSTNLFMITAFVVYILGHELITDRLFNYGTFDLNAPIVRIWVRSQLLFFSLGLACAGLSIVDIKQREKV